MSDPRLRGTLAINPLQDGMPAYQIAQLGTYDVRPSWPLHRYIGRIACPLSLSMFPCVNAGRGNSR